MTLTKVTLAEVASGQWRLTGELTFATCADSWSPLLACLQGNAVKLDVAGLIRVDSAGLATLVAWLAEARRRQISVELLGANEQLLQLARVGGVDTVLPLHWQADVAVNG
ncbi:MAG TPA: STAS domain-containing protein [Permianibacter sp.]|nr:STAS domain-containing protein [Permianibacter sp.]